MSSQGRSFYGPGSPYHLFTGTDASRALALTSTDTADVSADLSGLTNGMRLSRMPEFVLVGGCEYVSESVRV
jgi:hypothetical protein